MEEVTQTLEPLNKQQTLQIIRLESENVKLRSQVEAVLQVCKDYQYDDELTQAMDLIHGIVTRK